ncbi:MAG: hypothetical protein WED82_14225, partial [Balneolales bacterium]
DLVKASDWVTDIGPEGGVEGGQIIAEGTPEEVAEIRESYTGNFLKEELEKSAQMAVGSNENK